MEIRTQARIDKLVKKVKLEKRSVTVRNDQTIGDLVKEAKFNGFVNGEVNGRHFKEEKGNREKREAVLMRFNEMVTSDEVEAVAKRLKRRCSAVKGLLSFSIDHPHKQHEFTIVALGSDWRDPDGDRCVACLEEWDGERALDLYCREDEWSNLYFFLAFRESCLPVGRS